jgi:hypothetical protein
LLGCCAWGESGVEAPGSFIHQSGLADALVGNAPAALHLPGNMVCAGAFPYLGERNCFFIPLLKPLETSLGILYFEKRCVFVSYS